MDHKQRREPNTPLYIQLYLKNVKGKEETDARKTGKKTGKRESGKKN